MKIKIWKEKLLWLLVLFVVSFVSLNIGVKDFNFIALFKGDASHIALFNLSRLPRLLSIIITGASLSVAGLIMQTITNNKFVSPSTAGTMQWCQLGMVISILLFSNHSTMVQMLIAFIFALIGTLLFTQLLNKIQFKNMILVPLIGLMMGNVVSSVTSFFAYKYDIIQNLTSWMQGDFSLIIKGKYELLYIGVPLLIIAYLYAKQFTIAGMGKQMATNLGLNHYKITLLGLIIVSIISSSIVVTIGSIGFVGLIIPNLVSYYKGDHLENALFDTALLGAIFLLLCDIIGRVIIAPYEIPISVVVGIIGSIIFLWIMFRGKRNG